MTLMLFAIFHVFIYFGHVKRWWYDLFVDLKIDAKVGVDLEIF